MKKGELRKVILNNKIDHLLKVASSIKWGKNADIFYSGAVRENI